MASQDGVGWPDESTGFSLASAQDESRLVAEGLGWPYRAASRDRRVAARNLENPAASGAAGAVPHVVSGAAGVMEHEQVHRQRWGSSAGQREEPPARVKQALSVAVSRETSGGGPSGGEAVAGRQSQGSGTVRTRGRPAGGVTGPSETAQPVRVAVGGVPGMSDVPGPGDVAGPGAAPGPGGAPGPGAVSPTTESPAETGPAALHTGEPVAQGPDVSGHTAAGPAGLHAAAGPIEVGQAASGPAATGPSALMVHVVDLVRSAMMDLGVVMDLGMLDMGVGPHHRGGRMEADGARCDPHFQVIPSFRAKDVLLPHGCRSFSRRRPTEQSPPLRSAGRDDDRLWGGDAPTPASTGWANPGTESGGGTRVGRGVGGDTRCCRRSVGGCPHDEQPNDTFV